MSATLKPYPEYKDPGLPWLGMIPKHWEVRRFKYLLREVNSRSSDGQDQLLSVSQYTGVTPRGSRDGGDEPDTRAASLIGYKRVSQDDLVVNIMLAWNGSLGVAHSAGIVSPAYCVYRFNDNADPWYYHNLLRLPLYGGRIKVESTGVVESRLRLYSDDLFRIEAIVPPKKEQAAVAHFASATGRQVDRLIRAKRRLIALLNEQKQAIIQRAVTRGLDPNVRLKPSGVEWLGDVPENWEVRRLKTLCSMRSGDGITSMSIEPAGDYPVYGGNGVRGYTSNYTHDGDFALIGRQGALCGNVHIARGRFWASEHAVVASLRPGHVLDWFGAILVVMNLNQYSIAAAQPGLAVERVLNLWLPVPPGQEQALIAKHIEHETTDITKAVDRAQREISLLREYRSRLIADVVTGKLDVREAAERLPGEAEEPEPLDEVDALSDADEEAEADEMTDGGEQ